MKTATTTTAIVILALLAQAACFDLKQYKRFFKHRAKQVDICPDSVNEACCEAFEDFIFALAPPTTCWPEDGSDDGGALCGDLQAVASECTMEDIEGICDEINALDDSSSDDEDSESCPLDESNGQICGLSFQENPHLGALENCGDETDTDLDTDTDTETDTDTDALEVCEALYYNLKNECVLDGCPDPSPDQLCCDAALLFISAGCDDEDTDVDTDVDTETDICDVEFASILDYFIGYCIPTPDCAVYDPLPALPMCCTALRHKVGDGECDLQLNTEECAFDGGDCCEGSCVSTLNECGSGMSGFQCRDPDQNTFPCATYSKAVRDNCGDCFPVVANSAMGCCESSAQYIEGSCSLFEDNAQVTQMAFNDPDACTLTCGSVADCSATHCGDTCVNAFDLIQDTCLEEVEGEQCYDTTPGTSCCSNLDDIFDDTTCLPTAAYTNTADLPMDHATCGNSITTWGTLRAPCLVRVLRSETTLDGLSLEDFTQALIDAFGETMIAQLGVPAEAYVFFNAEASEGKAAGDAVANWGLLELNGVDISAAQNTLQNTDLTGALNTAFQAVDSTVTLNSVSTTTTVSTPPTTPTTSPASIASPSLILGAVVMALVAALRF